MAKEKPLMDFFAASVGPKNLAHSKKKFRI
jgi:hypothetical protein